MLVVTVVPAPVVPGRIPVGRSGPGVATGPTGSFLGRV